MDKLTVILARGDVDGVASAAIAARGVSGPVETRFLDSERLVDFFGEAVQSGLPRRYDLVICGLEVVHTDWDGRLVRPPLMDALRAFGSPVLWFSAAPWRAEDRASVQNILGEGMLTVDATAPCTAALVRGHLAAPGDGYAALLEQFAADRLPEAEHNRWGGQWRRVITSFRADLGQLGGALGPLLEERPGDISDDLLERADAVQHENVALAERSVRDPIRVGAHKLVTVDIPRERHAFWPEISACMLQKTGADFCLCCLIGRPVLILTRSDKQRADLRVWARYLTDLLPTARAIGEKPEAVPIHLRGLDEDPALKVDAIETLKEGAHLLAG